MTNHEIYKDIDSEIDALFNRNKTPNTDNTELAKTAIQKALDNDAKITQITQLRQYLDDQKIEGDPLEYLKAIDKVLKDNPDFQLGIDEYKIIYLEADEHLEKYREVYKDNYKSNEFQSLIDQIRQNRDTIKDLNTAFSYQDTWEGNINLRWLKEAEGLNLPQTVGGYLDLYHLTSAEGLNLPQTVGGDLSLYHLTSAEGLNLPQTVGGDLSLYHLTSAEGLNLPQTVGGSLHLSRLTSAEGLNLPQKVGGEINLGDLRSLKDVIWPEKIGGDLVLLPYVKLCDISNIPTGFAKSVSSEMGELLSNNQYHQGVVMTALNNIPDIIAYVKSDSNADFILKELGDIIINSNNYRPLTLEVVADNLEKFPKAIDYQKLIDHLIDDERYESIAKNLEKFPEGIINLKDLSDELLKRSKFETLVKNLAKFPPGAVDHKVLASKYFDDFKISYLSQVELEEKLELFEIKDSIKEDIRKKWREISVSRSDFI